ncbi:hypothetical protein [Methylopila sp. 73B]|uniref:hypothetical protein n=1 Tax=Methylopila sp. 73B TaxID=1120792 RepID=UPI0003795A74|nr:hypothetical protein [Methylopila sp. 73B]
MLQDDGLPLTSYGAEGYYGFMGPDAGYPVATDSGGFDWQVLVEGIDATGRQQAFDPLHAEDMIPGMVSSVIFAIDLPGASYEAPTGSFDFGGGGGGGAAGSMGGGGSVGIVTVGPIETVSVETEAE